MKDDKKKVNQKETLLKVLALHLRQRIFALIL